MNVETGREFPFTNPQDDPELYRTPPSGYQYDLEGRLVALPRFFGKPRHGTNYSTTTMKHPGVKCDLCRKGINGVRYKCLDCQDFDFCTDCERVGYSRHGGGTHVFAKIYDSRNVDANLYMRRQKYNWRELLQGESNHTNIMGIPVKEEVGLDLCNKTTDGNC